MPDIYSVAARTRRELLQHERDISRRMIDYYGETWRRIKARVDALNQQILEARLAGETVGQSWLFRRNRLRLLQLEVEREIGEFARYAGTLIAGGEAAAVEMAAEHARELVTVQVPSVEATWVRLPREAVQEQVGFLTEGSPLADLLSELGPEASKNVGQAMITGAATGQNPRSVARLVRLELGGNLVRALTIARTEMLRSYRMAAIRNYADNGEVVKGWVWHAALDRRTCAFCWSQHGRFFRNGTVFATHPNCRCSPVPSTRTWAELGIRGVPETRLVVEKGPAIFARLPEEQQLHILGPAKFAAYQDGKLKLEDVAGFRRDRKWGPVGYERSLKDILGEKDAAPYLKAARMRSPSSGSGSGSPPSGGTPPATPGGGYSAAEQVIRQIEDRIRRNTTESLHALDQGGNVVFSKQGGQSSVYLSPAEMAQLRGTMMTHNHPSGLSYPASDPRHGGNSFSPDDIGVAASVGAAEIRAVTPVWRFIMREPASGWDEQYWQQVVAPSFVRHEADVRREFFQAIGNGTMTRAEAEALHFHEIWSRVAGELGLDYRREP